MGNCDLQFPHLVQRNYGRITRLMGHSLIVVALHLVMSGRSVHLATLFLGRNDYPSELQLNKANVSDTETFK